MAPKSGPTIQRRVVFAIAKTGVDAGRVMVAQGVARPTAGGQCGQASGLIGAYPGWRQALGLHERKIENQVQLVVAVAHVGDVVRFAHEHGAGIGVNHRAQIGHQRMDARLIHLVLVHQAPLLDNLLALLVAGGQGHQREQITLTHLRGMIGQRRVFEEGVDGIQAEAVHAQVEPETRGREHRLPDSRMAPVEVGLLLEEVMVVVEAQLWHKFPGRTAKG